MLSPKSIPISSSLATPTPPAAPRPGQLWLSNSLQHMTVSPEANDRVPIVDGTIDATEYQEPSLWWANGVWNLAYTAGAIKYRSCAGDPTVKANWSAPTNLFGAGVNGVAYTVARCYVAQFGATLYYYFVELTASTTWYVATAPAATPTVVTVLGAVYTLPDGEAFAGNSAVVYDAGAGVYRMFHERLVSVPNDPALGGGTIFTWAVGMLTCATPTGTFAQQISHLETLRVKGYSSVSGPDMHFENGVWVMYYHAEEWANSAPDNIYRAISTTLAADAWTPLANSSPVIRRAHAYEAGLAADASVAQGPGGSWFAAWSSLNNRTSRGSIMLSPMLPSLRQWDGEEWQPAQRQNPSPIVTPEHALWRIENHMPWAGVESYSGGWTLDDNPGGWGPRYYSSGQGNYIAYDVILAPGTWRLEIFTQTGPVQADLTVDVDNGDSFWNLPTLGVLSCYAASTTAAVMVGPLTFTLAGSETVRRILRFSALTRNAANTTGWWTQLQGWVLRRVS